MADISKCYGEANGVICKKREWCLRYTMPKGDYQPYFVWDKILTDCDEFWDNGEKRKIIINKWRKRK